MSGRELVAGPRDGGRCWRPIYLDHHATTPADPRVVEVVVHAMTEAFGNANSVEHVFGEVAGQLVAAAQEEVAALVGAVPEDVRFTAGSSEGIRIALAHAIATRRSQYPLRVALSRVEHRALLEAVAAAVQAGSVEPVWIAVDRQARINMTALANELSKGIDLVCLMAANNEVGTIYPIKQVAALAQRHGAAVLVDATQAAGRLPLRSYEWQLDYLMFSAHKIYGPKGVGALVAPSLNQEAAVPGLYCGSEGTPNVPGISGMGEACRLRRIEMEVDETRISILREKLEAALVNSVPGLVVNGAPEARLGHNLHISAPGVPNDAVLARLRRKVAISTGAACSSGAQSPSHVLAAMNMPEDLKEGALRIGLGKFNTEEEIDTAAKDISEAIIDVRNRL